MRPRGFWVLAGLATFVALFMAAVWVLGNEFRQEYHVLSPGDRERVQLDLSDTHAAWVERTSDGWGVVAYDIAASRRHVVHPCCVAPDQPLVVEGTRVVWVEERVGGQSMIGVHDLAQNRTTLLDAARNLTLPGRTLEGDRLIAVGALGEREGAFLVQLPAGEPAPLKVTSLPRILDGSVRTWDWRAPSSPLLLDGGRVWWFDNTSIFAMPLDGGEGLAFDAGARVLSLDAHGGLVAWDEDRDLVRRVHFRSLANGTQGEVSAFPGDQHDPAVHGSRVVFVQHDRLVRLKDLGSGEERVLPARTQENRALRLSQDWAAWLSGTLEGHNVLLVPVR